MSRPASIWTIGHSNRPLDEFLNLLAQHEIECVADVRRFPGSRRQPEYAQEALSRTLIESGLRYEWMPALGGRRRPRADSPNTTWRNPSFRGYADYMATADFADAFELLLQISSRARIALMCAEVLWWRCHRALISDRLRVEGVRVLHIMSPTKIAPHRLTSVARVVDGRLTYRPEA